MRYLAVNTEGTPNDWASEYIVVAEDDEMAAVDLARHLNATRDSDATATSVQVLDTETVRRMYTFYQLSGVEVVSLGSSDTLYLAHDTAEHGPIAVVEAPDELSAMQKLKLHFGDDAPPDTDERLEFFDLDSLPWLHVRVGEDLQPTSYGRRPKRTTEDPELMTSDRGWDVLP